jgi:hypothetical protein
MPIYERISAVVSLTLIGLALYFMIEFPAQAATWGLFGTPLTLDSIRQWLMTLLLAGLTMAGMDSAVRPHLARTRLSYTATFWTLPGLLVLLATQTLGLAPDPVAWAGGLIGVGLLLWLTILAEFQQATTTFSQLRWSRLWEQVAGYGLALALFILIYQARTRSALSATEVTLVGGMAALPLLRRAPELASKTWLFAATIGLCLGQITFALNYWRIDAVWAGLFLGLIFYILSGLAQEQLSGKLSRRTLQEFAVIGAVGLAVIFYWGQ